MSKPLQRFLTLVLSLFIVSIHVFAQGPNDFAEPVPQGAIPVDVGLVLFAVVILILPLIFFLLTLQNTFNAVSSENRKMDGGLVWLTIIPLFGLVWQFIIVNRLADSLKLEFAKRNIPINEARPGINIGLAYCILFCCSIIPIVNIVTSIAGIVCWILYWVKINEYKSKLRMPPLR